MPPKSNNQKKKEAEAAGRAPKKTKQEENAGKTAAGKKKEMQAKRAADRVCFSHVCKGRLFLDDVISFEQFERIVSHKIILLSLGQCSCRNSKCLKFCWGQSNVFVTIFFCLIKQVFVLLL